MGRPWWLCCFGLKQQQAEQLQEAAQQSVPSPDADVLVFAIPEDDTDPKYLQELEKVSEKTGFPIDLLERMIAIGTLTSIRTSAIAIPRDSLDELSPDEKVIILGAHKTPPVGSKSNSEGSCHGKIPLELRFLERQDAIEDKDNNSKSQFPENRAYVEDPAELARLRDHTDWDITALRLYRGMVYFKMRVKKYNTETKKLDDGVLVEKHYCQEAETFKSIFANLLPKVPVMYSDPKVGRDQGRLFLDFLDDKKPANHCRIYLDKLILPAALQKDAEAQKLLEQLQANAVDIKDIKQLQRYIDEHGLSTCHVPLFASSYKEGVQDKFIPVMVQTGDNGEAIIRDADFEHFYKHPLIPPLANKSFNGKDESENDHMYGLQLLAIRLKAKTLGDFTTDLNELIVKYMDVVKVSITLDIKAIRELEKQGLQFTYTSLDKGAAGEINLENITDLALRQKLFLAKYNDVTTLADGMPFINYNKLDFGDYAKDVQAAIDYYDENHQELKNVGQSSAHDLVFLRQLSHRMAMHGDEAGHPKGKPEKFARITTYINGSFIITNTEEQYLKVLFSNPEVINEQIIGVHPYWLRTQDVQDDKTIDRTQLSDAWMDLLKIQALKNGLLIAAVTGADPICGFDIFVKTTLLNATPKLGDSKGLADIVSLVNDKLETLRTELMQAPAGALHSVMEQKVSDLCGKSRYNESEKVGSKFRVVPRKRKELNTVRQNMG